MKYTAEVALNRFVRKDQSQRRRLGSEEFLVLFRNAYEYLAVDRVSEILLMRFFEKVDRDRDGWVSYS